MVRGLVADQERGLLKERTAEVNLVLGSLISNVSARLNLVATVSRISDGSPKSLAEVAAAGDRTLVGQALLRPGPEGFVVELAAGPGMAVGHIVTGVRADAMRRSLEVPSVVSTLAMDEGGVKTLGFALGPPAAPSGAVVYRESVIKPGAPSSTTTSSPFSELHGLSTPRRCRTRPKWSSPTRHSPSTLDRALCCGPEISTPLNGVIGMTGLLLENGYEATEDPPG